MSFSNRSHLSINQFPNAKSLEVGETVLIRVTKLPNVLSSNVTKRTNPPTNSGKTAK